MSEVILTKWEAEQAAFMMEFCLSNSFCLGMDYGVAEDGGETKYAVAIQSIIEKLNVSEGK